MFWEFILDRAVKHFKKHVFSLSAFASSNLSRTSYVIKVIRLIWKYDFYKESWKNPCAVSSNWCIEWRSSWIVGDILCSFFKKVESANGLKLE